MQLSDDKIIRVYIFTMNGNQLLQVEDYFSFRKLEDSTDLLTIKGKNLPILPTGAKVNLVACGKDGSRVNFESSISLSLPQQLNVSFSQVGAKTLEERRRYFKMYCEIKCAIRAVERDEAIVELEPPAFVLIKNINLGGIFVVADMKKIVLKISDVFTIFIPDLMGSKLHAKAKVLRVQPAVVGENQGYGCCFLDLSSNDEQLLAKYITHLQLEKRKTEFTT